MSNGRLAADPGFSLLVVALSCSWSSRRQAVNCYILCLSRRAAFPGNAGLLVVALPKQKTATHFSWQRWFIGGRAAEAENCYTLFLATL